MGRFTTTTLLLLFALLLPLSTSCGGSDSGDKVQDQTGPGLDLTGEDAARDSVGPADVRADSTGMVSNLGNPMDGRLYAAVGGAVITPDQDNHPCPFFMGGTSGNRMSQGAIDALEARVVLLDKDNVQLILVSLDLVGWLVTDVDRLKLDIAALGLSPDHLFVSSTHTHAGPDTMGIWGDQFAGVTGRCPEYAEFLRETIIGQVQALIPLMEPVTMAVADVLMDEPLSNHPHLINDKRAPFVTNDHLVVASFRNDEGDLVGTMVNWHSHPESLISSDKFSADFVHWARETVEQETGATCAYFSGTVGGMMTPLGLHIPAYTEDGEPVVEDGGPVILTDVGLEHAWSLGYILGGWILKGLDQAQPVEEGPIEVETRTFNVPFENMMLILAYEGGLLESNPKLIKDDPENCGVFACMPIEVSHIRMGNFHIGTIPGELLSESSVGREEITLDFGEEWGERTFPAMEGYRQVLPEGHIMMDFGLTNNEIGYILPATDHFDPDHPEFYEETYLLSTVTEEKLRAAMKEMITN